MKRFRFDDIIEHLPKKQISLLVGARQVGKTTLLKQVEHHLTADGESVFLISLENPALLQLLNESPQNLFQLIASPAAGARTYILIDEIQYLDAPSNFLKFHYDITGEQLKFVVTGSSHFYIDRSFRDSMAGRKRIFELPTLGLDEVFHFLGRDDLVPYVGAGRIPLLYKEQMMPIFYDYLVYGGYPEVVLAPKVEEKKRILRELRDACALKDVQEAALQHPELYLKLMKVMADQIGSLFNTNALASELAADNKTLKNYLWVMRKAFHVHPVSPFHKRVASELRKMPKVFFADLGMRNSLLNQFAPIGTRDDRGDLLENYVYLRLKQTTGEEDLVKFWRTQNRQEVDFVVQRDDGTAAAYEVKWNAATYRPSKYAYFQKAYPEIPLTCISRENAFEADFKL